VAARDLILGLIVVDKPSGPTSFEVVQRVRRGLGVRRAGHTGTLDPLASGVLPICLGEATKLVPYLVGHDKGYRATARLGVTTDTFDSAGNVVHERPVPDLDDAAVEAALAPLRGAIRQRPPAFSAVHVDGERAMARARRGEAVEVPERDVIVHSLTVVRRTTTEIDLDVVCGSGTYVRSLVSDLGEALGCGAHLCALRRDRVGSFGLDQAISLADVEADHAQARARILSPADALCDLPVFRLDAEAVRKMRMGQAVAADPQTPAPGPLRCLDESGGLVAVGERTPAGVRPLRVFA